MKAIESLILMLCGFFLLQIYKDLLANDIQEVLRHRRKRNTFMQPDIMRVASRSHRHLSQSPLRPPMPEPSITEQRIAALENKLIYNKLTHDSRCSESCCAAVHAPFFGCIACLGILSQNPEWASEGLCYPYDMTMCAFGMLSTYVIIFLREFVLLEKIAHLKKEQ